MSETVLSRIAAQVRVRLEGDRRDASETALLARATRTPDDFAAPFRAGGAGIKVIAEVKLASPSEGAIAANADPVAVAKDYIAHGATALSILTERDSFGGHPDFLRRIRKALPEARLLMKDFVVDAYQLAQARDLGADAVLLIVALLGEAGLTPLLKRAGELGLTALVEVHDEAELTIALRAGAKLIGVNNRDLKTLKISLETSERLAGKVPASVTLISESGIRDAADIARLQSHGFHGFLVGTSLMKTGHPGPALARLIGEGK